MCKYPRDIIRTLKDGTVAIVANTEDGNYIYMYDSSSDTATQGVEYLGTETISCLEIF